MRFFYKAKDWLSNAGHRELRSRFLEVLSPVLDTCHARSHASFVGCSGISFAWQHVGIFLSSLHHDTSDEDDGLAREEGKRAGSRHTQRETQRS